ncbi:hypothetical protein VTK56DRAFT_5247 [Thermocarpiscus australiensis]
MINDYLADWDDDDLLRSPSPEPAKKQQKNEGQKKNTDMLGLDQQLDLKRRARAPRVKLDEARLLSDKGIPKLRKTAPKLKFKGKGHEFSDAARLLSFYQEWLDDLFPKATFLDALAMVEKAGHKKSMHKARMEWIEEGKPKATVEEEDDYPIHQASGPRQPERVAPIFEKAAQERAKTPSAEDLFGDEDIYNATPRRDTGGTAPSRQVVNDVPDGDDLDALMAEAEAEPGAGVQLTASGPASVPLGSIFGDGSRGRTGTVRPTGQPDEDDLDALMAEVEAETQAGSTRPSQRAVTGSIFGDSKPKQQATQGSDEHGDDLDALITEMEVAAETHAPSQAKRDSTPRGAAGHNEDGLDALMAEAEVEAGAGEQPSRATDHASSTRADARQGSASFDDEEEVMAEMDGLW